MTGDPFMRMTPLELAAGWVPGYVPKTTESRADERPREPIAVLEDILLDALQRRPCLVEFSGGRDSSAVLAVATDVARRVGLPAPIPITRFFPDAPESDEGDWPEMVVRHLGLTEWIRLQVRDELDLLGPISADGLRRHGITWPITLHTKVLTFGHGTGGVIVTGEGGDEVFGHRRVTPLTKMLAGARPRRLGVKPVVAALSPRWVRRYALEEGLVQKTLRPWLRPKAQRLFFEAVMTEVLEEPLAWSSSVLTLSRRRGWIMGRHNMSALAELHGVRHLHPLLEEAFLRAFSGARRTLGYPTRTHAMKSLFGHLLPEEVLARQTKATFNQAYVQGYTRAFVEDWEGAGVDSEYVDAGELKKVWSEPTLTAASLPLLVQAWLTQPLSPRW